MEMHENKVVVELAARLLALRKAKKLTQEEVAEETGIGYRSYRRYEMGEREPGVVVLAALADYYHVSADYLLGRTQDQ